MNRTPFYEAHRALGARLVDFAGWEMPIQYQSILAEHEAVRTRAGIFDISHMGQFWVRGPQALEFLQKVLTNDVRLAPPGKGLYGHLCKPTGGIIDDVFVYCLEPEAYLLIVNASRRKPDWDWLMSHRPHGAELMEAPQSAGLALQGPRALSLFEKILGRSCPLAPRAVSNLAVSGTSAVIARTGYTGEDGVEFFGPAGHLLQIWDHLFEVGRAEGLTPCGLGARDTLRLEMGYMLYGHDIDEDHTPLEAGLDWVVKLEKGDFVGRDALHRQKEAGLSRRLYGIKITEAGVPRTDSPVLDKGREIGKLCSGTYSPSLKIGIGMAYLPAGISPEGNPLDIQLSARRVSAVTHKPPFYKSGRPKPVAP